MGVTQYKNLPEDKGVEILLAGRSNAGKSSALNAITENHKLARISKTPGRTTEVNYFKVNDDLKLVDLPGYGYAKSGHSRKKDWGPLLSQYFNMRQSFKAVLLFFWPQGVSGAGRPWHYDKSICPSHIPTSHLG